MGADEAAYSAVQKALLSVVETAFSKVVWKVGWMGALMVSESAARTAFWTAGWLACAMDEYLVGVLAVSSAVVMVSWQDF